MSKLIKCKCGAIFNNFSTKRENLSEANYHVELMNPNSPNVTLDDEHVLFYADRRSKEHRTPQLTKQLSTALDVQQSINSLIRKALPPDNSAPLHPVTTIGDFVIKNWDLIERALVHYRQTRGTTVK